MITEQLSGAIATCESLVDSITGIRQALKNYEPVGYVDDVVVKRLLENEKEVTKKVEFLFSKLLVCSDKSRAAEAKKEEAAAVKEAAAAEKQAEKQVAHDERAAAKREDEALKPAPASKPLHPAGHTTKK